MLCRLIALLTDDHGPVRVSLVRNTFVAHLRLVAGSFVDMLQYTHSVIGCVQVMQCRLQMPFLATFQSCVVLQCCLSGHPLKQDVCT